MRIAEVVCTFPPYRGGIGNSVQNLAKILSIRGHEVTVFTPDYNKLVSDHNDIFKVRRLNPLFKFGNAACLPQLLGDLKGFQTVHFHLPFIGAAMAVFLFSIFNPKTKIIATYHMDLVGNGWKKIIFWFYQKFCVPMIFSRAARIIVSSFDYAEHSAVSRYFKKHKEKFLEIPFGVDAEKFLPGEKDAALLEKYFFAPSDKVILFVGGLDAAHYFKGLNILMKSFKSLLDAGRDNLRLLVVGGGDMAAHFKDMAQAMGAADKIIFTENVADEELPAHYNLADVFVLPSVTKSEAFGIVLLEAAACGKPLIASDLAGVRTLVRPGENGYRAIPGDSSDLAEKLLKILENDDLRRTMGENSRQMVLAGYTMGKMAEKTEKAL
jgi:glycosyltransferase involved in cell wall biosynthesis